MDEDLRDDIRSEEGLAIIQGAATVEIAVSRVRDAFGLGHVTYHLAQSVMGELQVDAPFVRTTYPCTWVARYLMKGYVRLDPIITEGFLRTLPFAWSEVRIPSAAQAMLADFKSHGLALSGYSIPIRDKIGRRALLSFNAAKDDGDWDSVIQRHKSTWLELSHRLHKKAIVELFGSSDPAPQLSPREMETLYWTAQGKDYKEIGLIMSISEHTIRTYMRSSRFKLDCANMSQAVAKAIKLRLINP